MEIDFKTKNIKQLKAVEYWLDNETEQILYGGAKGGGKSFLGVSLIFADALMYPQTHYFIARHELNDLRRFTIPTVQEVFEKWGIDINEYCSYNGQDSVYNFTNGSKVYLLSCKVTPTDPLFERFGSMQMTRGMIEEGGEIAEAAKDNLWLSIGRWKNDVYGLKKKLLITANPKKGWMKREFVDPYNQNLLPPSRKYIQAFASDNKYLSEDYIKTLSEQKDVVSRQRLYLGDWDYDESKDSIVSYDALTDVFTNTIVNDNEKYLIIDVARFGKDFTTFNFWDGLDLYKIDKRQKQGTNETVKQAKDFAASEGIPYSHILVDEDGIGGAVVDNMIGVKGFVANSSPLPTKEEIRTKLSKTNDKFVPKANYTNLKSQCGFKLAEMINEHLISISAEGYRDEIIGDLTALLKQKNPDSDRKLQLKSKEEVKEELGRSPDVGDPLIYRMYFELLKDAINEDPNLEKVISLQKDRMARNATINRSNK